MQSKDLRIGNLVKNNEPRYRDKILVIESIGDNDTVNVFFREYPMSALSPLPLIEEYLINFGFEKHEFDHKENQYRYKDRLIVLRDGKFVDYGSSVILEYVHELQNLYFALTKEELDFNARI